MNYKVCIIAAGIGSRMGDLSNHVNKAVLPVNFKGTISYIVEKFPKDIEIVIAVGHKKETIIDYLSLAHPDRRFKFVEVDKYMGPGTGPGYTLLQCKDELQCPFVFFAADTIVLEDVPIPDHNWFGISPVKDTESFCSVKIKNNLIYQLDDKIKTNNKFAFIGLAGVNDYELFFEALDKDRSLASGEIQVSNGFKKIIEKKLVPIGFTWFDTGTKKNYIETNKNFAGEGKGFDFSKGNEFLYFVNGRVIKYFADAEIAKKRGERAKGLLKGLCPPLEGEKNNFFSYKKVEGHTLYNVLNSQHVTDFLHWAKLELWKEKELSFEEKIEFKKACKKFYTEKTIGRLTKFYDKTGITDSWSNVNGVSVPPLKDLFKKIDWEHLETGIPSNYHGDLQFDNILVSRDKNSQLSKFILIDWRQDFGGLVHTGDLYYDLAKLYGGMTLSYKLIKEGKFSFDMSGSSVYYNYHVKSDLIEAKELYEDFLVENGFDLDKIKVLTSLIFLNMSPLHHDPFDVMLYYLGKSKLHKALQRIENKKTTKKEKEVVNNVISETRHWTHEF
jgi:choline kinase